MFSLNRSRPKSRRTPQNKTVSLARAGKVMVTSAFAPSSLCYTTQAPTPHRYCSNNNVAVALAVTGRAEHHGTAAATTLSLLKPLLYKRGAITPHRGRVSVGIGVRLQPQVPLSLLVVGEVKVCKERSHLGRSHAVLVTQVVQLKTRFFRGGGGNVEFRFRKGLTRIEMRILLHCRDSNVAERGQTWYELLGHIYF